MNAEEVLEIQQAVRRVNVDEELMNYTLAIVEKTRQHEYLSLGVSPRGSMSLYRAAQALAVMEGRSYCIPDDFKRLVIPVFSHRCIVSSRYLSTMKKSDQAEAILQRNCGIHARPAVIQIGGRQKADYGSEGTLLHSACLLCSRSATSASCLLLFPHLSYNEPHHGVSLPTHRRRLLARSAVAGALPDGAR